MNGKRPNGIQKFVHRFLALRPVSAALALVLRRVDGALFKLGGGHSAAELVGLPIVQLKTVGAKTRKPRTVPLVGLSEGGRVVLIGTNFGNKRNPAWYYNLKANPACEVVMDGRVLRCMTREVFDREYETYWDLALCYYSGYRKYRERAAPRHIPILLLEPAEDCQD